MKDSILKAIESICDDIATNSGAEENRKRAEAIVALTTSGLLLPDAEETEAAKVADELAASMVDGKLPKPGEHFTYSGMEFVALGEEQGGILAVAAEPLKEEMPFDEDGSNDWRKATLRKWLNEEHIKNFNRGDLLPFVSDLTSDDGMKDYGTSEDYIALLSCDRYRKYREYMPKYGTWVWTLTPWSCNPASACFVRHVNTSGALSNYGASNAYAVAAACIFNLSIFE